MHLGSILEKQDCCTGEISQNDPRGICQNVTYRKNMVAAILNRNNTTKGSDTNGSSNENSDSKKGSSSSIIFYFRSNSKNSSEFTRKIFGGEIRLRFTRYS